MKVQAVLTIRRDVGRGGEGYAEVSVRFAGSVDRHPHRDDEYIIAGRSVVEGWPGEVTSVGDLTKRERDRLDEALALAFEEEHQRERLANMTPEQRAKASAYLAQEDVTF